MPQTVVLLVSVPPLLESILENAVVGARDVRLAGTVSRVEELPEALARTGPDVLILGLDGSGELTDFRDLLYAHPRMRLLGIDRGGRDLQLFELRPELVTLGNLSPGEILDVIRRRNGAEVEP